MCQVGPATFEQPGRSWALEELDRLWLPTSAGAGVHTGADAEDGSAAAASASGFVHPSVQALLQGTGGSRLRQYRMVSVRLYPLGADAGGSQSTEGRSSSSNAGALPSKADGNVLPPACEDCRMAVRVRPQAKASPAGSDATRFDDALPQPWWDGCATPAESAGIWAEEASLVLSLLEESKGDASAHSAADLQQAATLCEEDALRELWREVRRLGGGGGAKARQLLRHRSGDLVAAILFNELSQDVIAIPTPWHYCAALPWQCHGRKRRSRAVRRLLYWLQAFPPLSAERTQQYVCCENYSVAAIRRDDGVHCWGIMEACPTESQGGGYPGAQPQGGAPGRPPAANVQGRALAAVANVLRELPRCADLRSIFD
eukprot:TRINITY_DN3495_c0_g2_i2.p1 TRINITY_DN3495_c0_g2~~TRINITY_DN3495_c0_g2_i2.p1  ORF type:complete len:402 (-),score=98.50 TRINITY_DN3495_c0_g2_i2:70-1188(-)